MNFRGRTVSVDWGHLIVLLLIAAATGWYLLDARSVSTAANNLLLIQPLSIIALILVLVILPQCFRVAEQHADGATPVHETVRAREETKASDLMQPKLPTERVEVIKLLMLAGLLGLFVFLLKPLGFDVAIFLFSAAGMAICGERRPLPLIAFPVIVTLVVVMGFKALMPYPMPTTIL